jgi:pyridoxal phosphate enzyme (YggS family)
MTRQVEVRERIQAIKNDLGDATLIVVTKYSPIEDLMLVVNAHHFYLGESKVADLKSKARFFFEKKIHQIRWHFIGHLQSNKVKELLRIPNLHAVHSVDSLRILEEIVKHKLQLSNVPLNIFLQINTSHEKEKSGFESLDELDKAIELLLHHKSYFNFAGLMTMGTMRTNDFEIEAKRCFTELSELKNNLEKKYSLSDLQLSMGMSQDYKIALAAGANLVRIGSAIFRD